MGDQEGKRAGLDAVTLLCGDCLTQLSQLAPHCIDVVVTSPPYNLGVGYRAYRDQRQEGDYLDWMVEVATALRRVLKPDGSFFLNISGSSSSPWLPFELIVRLRPLFVLQNHITWIKSIAIAEDSVGHFKPVGGRQYPRRPAADRIEGEYFGDRRLHAG